LAGEGRELFFLNGCAACHAIRGTEARGKIGPDLTHVGSRLTLGAGGRRTKSAYPSLAGQPAEYLQLQLELFKRGQRGGSDHAHLMDEVAPRLSPEHIRAVSLYFASLPAGEPRESAPPGRR
jgi:cytochrome c553